MPDGEAEMSNDTLVTLVGNVATEVKQHGGADGEVARFRLAVAPRRWDRQREEWVDVPASFYTVWARRSLAANLSSSLSIGEPVIVHGRLRVREEERDGRWRCSADVDAVTVGHDLARGTSAFKRVVKVESFLTERPKDSVPYAART